MLDLLKPLFRDTWAPLGEGLRCGDVSEPGAIRLSELTGSQEVLESLLIQCAAQLGTTDLRPVASAWMLRYTALLLPPVAAASTLLQYVLPLDDPGVALTLDNGNAECVLIPHSGFPAPGSGTATRYASLLEGHLAPLVNRLSETSKLPTKILWGNIARRLDALFDQAKTLAPSDDAMTCIAHDRDHLLQQSTWRDGRRNPLFGQRKAAVHERTGEPVTVRLHRQCCLNYLLPEKGHCGLCPLATDIRLLEQEES